MQTILLAADKPAYWTILVISGVVILSFLFNRIAKKTNIPSVLMLIVLGVALHFGLEAFGIKLPKNTQESLFLEIIGLVGLTMIVLEAALDLELTREKWPIIWKSFSVALLSLVASAFVVALVIWAFGVKSYYVALIYAVPLSIMSSAIIIPSVGGLRTDKKEFMVYESAFSDILGIMFFYFLLDGDKTDGGELAFKIVLNITVTIIAAVVASYVLVIFFQRLRSQVKLFLLIAVLLLLMVLGKIAGLSSLVIILVFGLAVNNRKLFFRGPMQKFIDEKRMEKIEHELHVVTLETSFLVRTFFFVALGVQIDFATLADPMVALKSVMLVGGLFGVRWVMLKFFVRKDIFPQIFIAPRGLITILLFLDLGRYLYKYPFENGVLLYSILLTSIVMTWALIKNGKGISHVNPEKASLAEGDIHLTADGEEPEPVAVENSPEDGDPEPESEHSSVIEDAEVLEEATDEEPELSDPVDSTEESSEDDGEEEDIQPPAQ